MSAEVRVADRPTLADPQPWRFPAVEHLARAHGPDLWVCDLPGQALLTVRVVLDAPLDIEPLDRAGVGTITAWALDEGAGDRDANELAAWKDRLGASLGTSVSSRGTTVSVDAPPAGIIDAVDLLAEVIRSPHLPAAEIDRLTRQRLDSIRQEHARVPGRATLETRRRLFAPTSRSLVAAAGDERTLLTIDRDAVTHHHADRLLQAATTIVVAGDLSLLPESLVERVVDRLGDVGGTRATTAPDPGIVGERQVVLVDRPGAVQTGIEMTRAGVDRHADDWAALRVAMHVLGGTLTSRLDAVLREQKGFTYGARSSLTTLRRGGWNRLVAGAFETPTTGEAMADMIRIIDELRAGGPTSTEVDDAVRYLGGIQPLRYERAASITAEISRNLADGFDPTHTDVEHERLIGVSHEAVAAAAAAHLRTDDVVIVLVGDAATIAEPVAEALGEAPLVVPD